MYVWPDGPGSSGAPSVAIYSAGLTHAAEHGSGSMTIGMNVSDCAYSPQRIK